MAFLVTGVVSMSALVPLLSQTTVPIQSLVGLLIAAILVQAALAFRRRGEAAEAVDRRPFFIGLVLLTAAAAFSLADVTRAFCDPANHWLQGHAIWHVLPAASLYAMFRFYETLEDRERI